MVERMMDYKKKCNVLKQIQSDKALFYKYCNAIQSSLTVFVASLITFIGFSGIEKINDYLNLVLSSNNADLKTTQMAYNISVFILFVCVIFHLVFQLTSKQTASEKAVSLLSSLINEIDDLIDNVPTKDSIDSVRYKYITIISIIPSNTDR